jgi:hypothetical protein
MKQPAGIHEGVLVPKLQLRLRRSESVFGG